MLFEEHPRITRIQRHLRNLRIVLRTAPFVNNPQISQMHCSILPPDLRHLQMNTERATQRSITLAGK
jgi:hypothetical protein